MKVASVKGQKSVGAAPVPADRRLFWQTPMVQRFAIVCTATSAAGWRKMPTRAAESCF
jgi:hypothetical protein